MKFKSSKFHNNHNTCETHGVITSDPQKQNFENQSSQNLHPSKICTYTVWPHKQTKLQYV